MAILCTLQPSRLAVRRLYAVSTHQCCGTNSLWKTNCFEDDRISLASLNMVSHGTFSLHCESLYWYLSLFLLFISLCIFHMLKFCESAGGIRVPDGSPFNGRRWQFTLFVFRFDHVSTLFCYCVSLPMGTFLGVWIFCVYAYTHRWHAPAFSA